LFFEQCGFFFRLQFDPFGGHLQQLRRP